jgi:hypothetical protein
MHQDNPCAAHHSGAHGRRHLKVYNIPLSIGILHSEDRLPSLCHCEELLLQYFGMSHGQA